MRNFFILLFFLPAMVFAQPQWKADNGDGTFTNPLLWGDWPDPDVIRVGDMFYMVTTSMHYVPGAPVLSSRDLVNWRMEGYAVERYDEDPRYDMEGGTLYLNGSWAANIRHHRGKFYVCFCTPYGLGTEKGHFSVCEADKPSGPWKRTIFPEYLYDPGLFIDDDGRVYVVHGQGTLYLTELTEDLHAVKTPAKEIWRERFGMDRKLGSGHYGMEGSHVYKINGMYYITCPAGGTEGWQVCLRSKSITGPYEHRIIMDDDSSWPGNGLHQGGMVQLKNGDWWFVIMQDRGAIGRVPCLVPVTWDDGWPMLGAHGKDAITYQKPEIKAGKKAKKYKVESSDNFSSSKLGLQWQWNHNPDPSLWSLTERRGFMRLKARGAADLNTARGTLTQRVQGPVATGTVLMDFSGVQEGNTAGFGIFESPYAYLAVKQTDGKRQLVMCNDDEEIESTPVPDNVTRVWLRVYTSTQGEIARFSYSWDGKKYTTLGNQFKMELGLPWTANRYALFCFGKEGTATAGYADFDEFIFQ